MRVCPKGGPKYTNKTVPNAGGGSHIVSFAPDEGGDGGTLSDTQVNKTHRQPAAIDNRAVRTTRRRLDKRHLSTLIWPCKQELESG